MARASFLSLSAIRERLAPIFDRYQIEKAIVFGSYARGDITRRSDVDLILIQETDKRFLDRYEGIFYDINQALGSCGADVLIYTPEELQAISHRRFISRALREGKVIYERAKEPA